MPRNIRKDIESAPRRAAWDAEILQTGDEQISPRPKLLDHGDNLILRACNCFDAGALAREEYHRNQQRDTDDGVRVWYDAGIVINKWFDQAPTTYTFTAFAGAGMHTFRVEYYEHTGGAQIKVQISGVSGGAGDVVVDDAAPGWQAGGCYYCWHVSPAGVGAHSFWTFNNTYAVYGYNWARWNVSLPQSRLYEVFAYIPAGVGNTSNARYWISHAGYYNLVARNQGLYANQWVSLGTYWFSAGAGQYVSLSDVTGECYLCRTMVFDAVKFSPR